MEPSPNIRVNLPSADRMIGSSSILRSAIGDRAIHVRSNMDRPIEDVPIADQR
jgi:hypothetical protein